MMNLLAMLKKKSGSPSRGAHEPRPGRDWFILLGTALVLIGVSVMWNVGLFTRVANGDLSSGGAESNVLKTYPAGAIDELFENRAQMEAAYRSSFPFVDPSR